MAVEIVKEIIDETKLTILGLLPALQKLDYEHDVSKNADSRMSDRFGFIAKDASFKDGSALGFTTMEHTFQLILTDSYNNKDSDVAQSTALNGLYTSAHCILKDLQKKPLTLPTAGYRVLLVSGVGFDDPEHDDENSSIVLRVNFLYTYRFRNNI